MNRPVVMALACMVGLAGCAGPVLPPGVSEQQPHATDFGKLDFACPAAGTIVEHWAGEPLHYLGAVQGDPVTCRLATATGGEQRQLYLVLGDPTPATTAPPLAGQQELREAMARLWPLEAGKATTLSYLGNHGADGAPFVTEVWRVLGPMEVSLRRVNQMRPATREAVRVERLVQSVGGSGAGTQTRWIYVIDRQTRALLRTGVQMYRGGTAGATAPSNAIAFDGLP